MTDITLDLVGSFRSSMHAFNNPLVWTDESIMEALCEADCETGGRGWGIFKDECKNFKRRGMFYFAAHWLSVTYSNGTSVDAGAISPSARLNIVQKSVADESVQYRATSMEPTTEDWLSLTNYGVQFMRLKLRIACAMIV